MRQHWAAANKSRGDSQRHFECVAYLIDLGAKVQVKLNLKGLGVNLTFITPDN